MKVFDFFLPQTQEDKQNSTDIANQSVISSECVWSRQLVVNLLCFLGLMDGMNLDVCIDGIKSEGKMINQGTWRQTVTFRWYITDTIIELCHSLSKAVKYLLQLLITDTMRTCCHVPTAAAISLSHVGTHWPPSLCFADSPRVQCRQRSASSMHMCLLLYPCTAAGTDISCVCTCDSATRSSFGYAEDTMALFNSPTYNYSRKWWKSSVPASCIIVSLFCYVCLWNSWVMLNVPWLLHTSSSSRDHLRKGEIVFNSVRGFNFTQWNVIGKNNNST